MIVGNQQTIAPGDAPAGPAIAPVRRVLGATWRFRFTWYQPDGVTPVDLTGKQFSCDLIAQGQFVPIQTVSPSNDADTNLSLGMFKFVFPPNLVTRSAGVTSNGAQELCRIHVYYVDTNGDVDSVLVQFVQVVVP